MNEPIERIDFFVGGVWVLVWLVGGLGFGLAVVWGFVWRWFGKKIT